MGRAFFFGYGSLVNRRTHSYPSARPARLKGWRREWRLTRLRPELFLSARPDREAEIEGLIAEVPGRNWAALDLRERAYRRHRVSDRIDAAPGAPADVQVYAVRPRLARRGSGGGILLSYLDVVVQGFLRQFGETGVTRFFETTDGWDRPVIDDRRAPRYPRHQCLTPAETTLVDDALAAYGIRCGPLE